MMEIDIKEYNAVVLGALLHDIGKFLHRGDSEYKGAHEEASFKFIKKHDDKLRSRFYDIDLVAILTKLHGSTKGEAFTDEYFSGKADGEKEKIWKLIKIVMDADSYSCAERDTKQQRKKDIGISKTPLDSIFSIINLDPTKPAEENELRYNVKTLEPLRAFPEPVKALDKDFLRNFIEEFEKNIPDFSVFKTFDYILNKWLNLLEKYTWAVPSDTRYEFSDISLFDHLRSSAAIATCLYKRHIEDINAGKRLKRKYEFVLIGGDFSGIQNYIFDITNRGSGGASKRLRARSFFVTLFSEVTIHKILHALKLPFVCNIFSAGGKFLLIAPNLDGIEDILHEVKHEIDLELHNEYFSQFSFLMTWKDIKVFRDETKIFNFFKLADEMFYLLEYEKVRKSQSVLQDRGKWHLSSFKAERLYESYEGTADCKICGKGPAIHKNPDDGQLEACDVCYRDELMGQILPRTEFIAFGREVQHRASDNKFELFKSLNKELVSKAGYFVELLKDYRESDSYYLIYKIGSHSKKPPLSLNKYYANHVPLKDRNQILTFEDISEKSRWQRDDKTYGSDLLGVLKADVDNLGLIFSKGFEIPRKVEEELPELDRKTVSRYLTLSRMFELFFSGWMKEIMSENHKDKVIKELSSMEGIEKESFENYLKGELIDFRNIYTVYSGGDDLVFVGPWETMIIFSIYLNRQFRRFTCQNKFITISAGLTFVKEKHPIASAIKQADELLEKSKKEGKNSFTFFGTTIEWELMTELINYFLFLNSSLNDEKPRIKSAFLYNLLQYHQMAKRFIDENRIEGLKYVSALSYDIGRNIVEWDKTGKIKKGFEEYEKLQQLINEKPDKNSLIYNIKIPLFWTLYRSRSIKT
jgi:CRISPR-associated protein Csm1